MKSINIHEAKTHLSRFVEDAASGQEIVIARAGRPVARLVALEPADRAPRELGLGRDRFNIPADFDHRDQAAVETMFYGTNE
ncbi:MAG: type II toxin-antitoxin system Phd/YefM family antitoxin [Spiribacter salinus]|uniref:Antitoxin n=1 Tax=Spiribacter salinus TaxID=1335746 RepID=A0A540VF32_9GAMM|nr:MAG: type II toxin-antitoxin system Phd/YefM family antitoxin [Spiribacter salinus]